MYEGDVQTVLRCGQCNKPFDKPSTLKRHGYYCRSRRVGSTIRSRSCTACAKGKTRCDNKQPECSRCATKAIECHYLTNSTKGTRTGTQHVDDGLIERRGTAPSLVADSVTSAKDQEASEFQDMILDDPPAALASDLINLEECIDWNDPIIKTVDFLNQPTNDETTQYHPLSPASLFRHSSPSITYGFQVQQSSSSLIPSIPSVPSTIVRSLTQRPKPKTGTHGIVNLMLHTLKSYPMMIMRNALPPFIHPHLISSDVGNKHMEPLTNCISLVHMISAGVQGSRKLFWKNVRLECERVCEEHLSLNKWEVLAAMQALAIYVFIRLDEGEKDYNNFDFLLLTTVTALAKQATSIMMLQPPLYTYGLETSWQDWIYEESCRRLCVVYQIMNMIVYFDPAALCDHDANLILGPLPMRKQLWEAGDEFAWAAESTKEPGIQTGFGLAVNGELVRLDESRLHSDSVLLHKSSHVGTSSRSAANWEEWCSGMDGLGGLVMLAASLVA